MVLQENGGVEEMKKMLTLTVSIDIPFPKMVKKEKEYVRRKLIKKDFRVLSFEE